MEDQKRFQQLRDQLKSVLQALSDHGFQQRVWIRREDGSPSSLDFATEVLFDYEDFRDPASCVGSILRDEHERRAIVAVLDAIDALGLEGADPASKYLSHPEWSKVMEAAGSAFSILEKKDNEQ